MIPSTAAEFARTMASDTNVVIELGNCSVAVILKSVLTRVASRFTGVSGIVRVEVRHRDIGPPDFPAVGFEVRMSPCSDRHLVMVNGDDAVWSGEVAIVGPMARSAARSGGTTGVWIEPGDWLDPDAVWRHRVPFSQAELRAVAARGGVEQVELRLGQFDHGAVVRASGTRQVRVTPTCVEAGCSEDHDIAPIVVVATPDVIHDAALLQASAADDHIEPDDAYPAATADWLSRPPLPAWTEPPPPEEWQFEDLLDDGDPFAEEPLDEVPEAPAATESADRLSGLADVLSPPASWGPRLDVLRGVLHDVAAGRDLLADLVDVDEFHVRGVARALSGQLDDLRMRELPAPGKEREWIAERFDRMRAPELELVGRWATASVAERDAAAMAVENATWLFCGRPVTGVDWCAAAAKLLDESADDVPASVRCRITDPLELIAVAAVTLAVRGLDGEVPGIDVPGVDLWFATDAASAELAARGPLLGRNDEGDVPANGLVVVIGSDVDRRHFIDAVELAVHTGPSVRVAATLPDGPHLAALSVAREVRPVLLNAPEADSPFADPAHLPHLLPEPDPATAAQRIADRWTALVAVGRDPWWEEQPRLYLPALLHALFLERGRAGLPAAAVVDAMHDHQLVALQALCRRRGLDSVADRLAGLNGLDGTGSTGLSLRITMNAAVPSDPVAHGTQLRPARLGREAVILPPGATAIPHAAIELAEAGCAVFWDDAHLAARSGSWLTGRQGALTVIGFPTAATVKLPMDTLRSATVIAYPGAGDLAELAGRVVDPFRGEAAMLRGGTLTYLDPVDRVLARVVAGVRRDALTRCTTTILSERLAA